MTNIVATITTVVITNWVTFSTETPFPTPRPSYSFRTVDYYVTNHQIGFIQTNYIASILWNGKTNSWCIGTNDNNKLFSKRSVAQKVTEHWNEFR